MNPRVARTFSGGVLSRTAHCLWSGRRAESGNPIAPRPGQHRAKRPARPVRQVVYREAIRLDPEYPEAHCNLGHNLSRLGRFKEALAALRRGHELGSRNPRWRYPSAHWVAQCERLVELDGKLSQVLGGEREPAGARERLALATICRTKKLHAAEARFWKDALAAEPALVEIRRASHRYNAACAAALAGCAFGEDADTLDEAARAQWRKQALTWLRAELTAWRKQIESEHGPAMKTALRMLAHSKRDPDFAGIREQTELGKLPESEHKAWRAFWAEVDATLASSNAKK